MIDVHAHLTSPDFQDDLEAVLNRARESGVEIIFVAGEDYEDNLKVLALARKYGMLRACLGHHPVNLDRSMANATAALIRENLGLVAAIGEVGLDHWKVQDGDDQKIQGEIFGLFIELSKAVELPIVVHSRSAGKRAIDMLKYFGASKVCLHAFDGKASSAKTGVDLGYFFSIPPSINRSPQKQKLVTHLPLDTLLLETDSPVLGPLKQERNEPANIIYAARKIAEIKGAPIEDVTRITRDNTNRLFGLPSRPATGSYRKC